MQDLQQTTPPRMSRTPGPPITPLSQRTKSMKRTALTFALIAGLAAPALAQNVTVQMPSSMLNQLVANGLSGIENRNVDVGSLTQSQKTAIFLVMNSSDSENEKQRRIRAIVNR